MKRKLLVTTDTFFPKRDGVVRFIDEILPELTNKYDITLLAPSYSKKIYVERFKGMDVVRFPTTDLFSLGGYPAVNADASILKKYIKEADIVWVNSAAPLGMRTILISKSMKKPIIAYMHSIEWEQLSHIVFKSKRIKTWSIFLAKRFGRYLYNKCSLLIVSSKSVADDLNKAGIKTKKAIVPLGTDVYTFRPPKDKDLAKSSIGISPEYDIIGYTGRIGKEKNLHTLFKAFAELKEKNDKIKLLIVGDGDKSDIKEYIDRYPEDIIITGFVNDVALYLKAMDIFVMPSLTETTSLSTMEAMASGLPVIATPVGHIKEYIKSGYNGYLFPRENIEVLKQRIEKLLKSKNLRRGIGMMARKTIETKYFWERTIGKLQKILAMY